jgi:hypothetical protein
VRSEKSFTDEYGSVNSVELSIFKYRLTMFGSSGKASFVANVYTDKGEFRFNVDLIKTKGVWSIDELKLE